MLAQRRSAGHNRPNNPSDENPGFPTRDTELDASQAGLEGREPLRSQDLSHVRVECVRDDLLELRLYQEREREGALESFLDTARKAELVLGKEEGEGLGGVLADFFRRLKELGGSPSSLPARQGVLEAAKNLTEVFRWLSLDLEVLRRSLDEAVGQTVATINDLSSKIARLNEQIAALVASQQNPGESLNQRNQCLRELSGLIDISVIDAQDGTVAITTSNSAVLVAGKKDCVLEPRFDPVSKISRIYSQGAEVTSRIPGGQLGGELRARDETIGVLLADLNMLGFEFIHQVNAVHRSGYDLTGAVGSDLFTPLDSLTDAASSLSLHCTYPEQVAASLTGTAGDKGNAAVLTALSSQPIVNGQSPLDFYAGLADRVEKDVAEASAELEAERLVIQQLKNQRVGASGVSLQEESAGLLRFQRALEASARVAGRVDDLTKTAISAGRK